MSPKINWGSYGALVEIEYTNTFLAASGACYSPGDSYSLTTPKLFVGTSADALTEKFDSWFLSYDNKQHGHALSHSPKVVDVAPIDQCVTKVIHASFKYKPWDTSTSRVAVSRKPVAAYFIGGAFGKRNSLSWVVVNPRLYEFNYKIIGRFATFSDPVQMHVSNSGAIEFSGWFDVTTLADQSKASYVDLAKSRFQVKLDAYKQEQLAKLDVISDAFMRRTQD